MFRARLNPPSLPISTGSIKFRSSVIDQQYNAYRLRNANTIQNSLDMRTSYAYNRFSKRSSYA